MNSIKLPSGQERPGPTVYAPDRRTYPWHLEDQGRPGAGRDRGSDLHRFRKRTPEVRSDHRRYVVRLG